MNSNDWYHINRHNAMFLIGNRIDTRVQSCTVLIVVRYFHTLRILNDETESD
jgi:hypothetical protein